MNIYHILNGDCLAESFPKNLIGEIIIWREALVDGPLSEENFFKVREAYISTFTEDSDYEKKVISEFTKIKNIEDGSQVYFWFEDDLFCQVNFWFLISFLKQKSVSKFRVFPRNQRKGFAFSDEEELLSLKDEAQLISDSEIDTIITLWQDYQRNALKKEYPTSQIVRNLPEILIAQENRFNGVLTGYLKELLHSDSEFKTIIKKFQKNYPIYGFGDLQLKNLLKDL